MIDYGWGSSSNNGPSYVDVSRAESRAIKQAVIESERLVIKHVELATGKKHVMVNGQDK